MSFEITLIGRKVDVNSTFSYLPSLFEVREPNELEVGFDLRIYEYDYKEDGIHFKEVTGYSLIEEGF